MWRDNFCCEFILFIFSSVKFLTTNCDCVKNDKWLLWNSPVTTSVPYIGSSAPEICALLCLLNWNLWRFDNKLNYQGFWGAHKSLGIGVSLKSDFLITEGILSSLELDENNFKINTLEACLPLNFPWSVYDSFSDVGESRVCFASKNLTFLGFFWWFLRSGARFT